MADGSGVCVSKTPRWDFKLREVAQGSFRRANHLLNCISDESRMRSIQEVSLTAEDAVNGFRKLFTLLDGSLQLDCKRIRKGPLPKSHNVNPIELMDGPHFASQNSGCRSSQPIIPRQFVSPRSNQSNTVLNLIPRNTVVLPNLIMGLHHSSTLSMSSSEIAVSQLDKSCMFRSKRKAEVETEEVTTKFAASTCGCHCSKGR